MRTLGREEPPGEEMAETGVGSKEKETEGMGNSPGRETDSRKGVGAHCRAQGLPTISISLSSQSVDAKSRFAHTQKHSQRFCQKPLSEPSPGHQAA